MIVFGIAAAPTAFAHGFGFGPRAALPPAEVAQRQATVFAEQAKVLGVDVDVVKDGWADGESLHEIAREQGITPSQLAERMRLAKRTRLAAQLDALVANGVVTRAQADKRLQRLDALIAKRDAKVGRHHFGYR